MTKKDLNIEECFYWMQRALQLAELADGETSPNPLVGAVVLDSQKLLIGEGFHSQAGSPHAEVEALRQAGDEAKGGTLLVTLEPCCHYGLTPPCTDLIVQAGISRVVVGLTDPDPRVSGKGIRFLKEAGIEVITGILEQEISYQNRAFIFRIKTGRPWGILKLAMSLDGRTALSNGKSKWITSQEARAKVHALRAKCDAVIIGGGTLRTDDPLLTSRGLRNPEPIRVVFSESLSLPIGSQIWKTQSAKTILAYSSQKSSELFEELPEQVEKLRLSESSPTELLKQLGKKGCNRILWECGPSLATTAIKQNCVQEIVIFIAPKLLGGLPAMTLLGDFGFEALNQSLILKDISLAKSGKDFVLNTFLKESQ